MRPSPPSAPPRSPIAAPTSRPCGDGSLRRSRTRAELEDMRPRISEAVAGSSRARAALATQGLVVLSLREELSPDVDVEGLVIERSLYPAEGIVAGDSYTVLPLSAHEVAVGLFYV